MGEQSIRRRGVLRRVGSLTAPVVALAAPVVALAACGTSATEAPKSTALRSGVTVTLMSGEDPQSNLEARAKQIANFRQQYPGIQIDRQRLAGYATKLIAAFAAGTPPDLFTTARNDITSQAPKGMALALDDLIKRDKLNLNDYYPASYEQYRFESKLYAMSYDFPNRCLFVNVKAFDEAGVRRPPTTYKDDSWNWDVFRTAMEGLMRRFGSDGTWAIDGGRALRAYMPWVWNAGGDMISKDGREVVLNQPPGVEALQFLQDIIYKYRVAPPQEGRPDPRKLFTQGKMLVYEEGQTIIGQLRSDIKGALTWDVVPVPKGKGTTRAASGGGSGYAMANPALNREEAWAFFKHLSSRQSQEIWMVDVGAMVPFRALVESPAFLQTPPDHMSLFVEGASLLRLDPTAVRWSEISPVLDEEMAKLWSGASPAKAVADAIKTRVDPLLK